MYDYKNLSDNELIAIVKESTCETWQDEAGDELINRLEKGKLAIEHNKIYMKQFDRITEKIKEVYKI